MKRIECRIECRIEYRIIQAKGVPEEMAQAEEFLDSAGREGFRIAHISILGSGCPAVNCMIVWTLEREIIPDTPRCG